MAVAGRSDGSLVAKGPSGHAVALCVPVAAAAVAELEVDIGAQRLLLRDREGARCLELPFSVTPEACRVRFSARRRELTVELCPADDGKAAAGDDRKALEAGGLANLLGPRPARGPGLAVHEGALAPALAEEVRSRLAALPAEAWQVAAPERQPLGGEAAPIDMRFHRLERRDGMEELEGRVLEALAAQLAPGPCERLLLNFSKYEAGDFLASHPDVPSGSRGHERRQAFVWHLSAEWEEGDGGLFVDEDAEGGPRAIVPRFNTLVTFPVPRWHSVTKVTARNGKRARYAAYGWVVTPCITEVRSVDALEELLSSARGRPLVVACVCEPLRKESEALTSLFASLPIERVGHYCLGDHCAFAATADHTVAQHVGVAEAQEAVAVLAGSGAMGGSEGLQILADPARLRSYGCLRRFVEEACESCSHCPELDISDHAMMEEICCSPEVKVFIVMAFGDRTPDVISTLRSWASALKPRLRLLLADPSASAPLLADFELAPADAPTAVAWDTQGSLGRARLKDHMGGARPGHLELPLLRQWLGCVAEAAGIPSPQLQ